MSQVTEESCMPHVIRTVGFLFITWHLHNKINLRHAWVGLPFHTWAIKVGVFINNEVDQLSSMVIYLFVADVPICTPWNYQKTKGFQVFSEVRKRNINVVYFRLSWKLQMEQFSKEAGCSLEWPASSFWNECSFFVDEPLNYRRQESFTDNSKSTQ